MAINTYVQINGKKYKVMADGWEPENDRQRTYDVGLTGKSIIIDLTNSTREPRQWRYRLKVFINDPDPDTTWGTYADLLAAFAQPYITLIEHDDTISHDVGFPNPIVPGPRVPAAAITGICHEVYYIPITLLEVYS